MNTAAAPDWCELVSQQYRRILIRSVLPIVREPSEAEDVVQQALLHAFQHLDQFEGKAKFSTWLSRIALYEALGRVRGRRSFSLLSDGPDDRLGPEERALRAQREEMVRSAVHRLPAGYRNVVICRALDEMSTRETGERLRLSDEAVKTRFHRARAMLKRELAEAQ